MKLILLILALLCSLRMTFLATPGNSQSARQDAAGVAQRLVENRAVIELNSRWSEGRLRNDHALMESLIWYPRTPR